MSLALVAVVLSNCANDFDLTANWKEIPVVYAILSAKDTANYVRVEKAFLDPETNALQIAQIADSLYYPAGAVTVFLEQVSNGKRIPLSRIDGTLDGIVRTGDIFANKPNWLYKTKEPLLPKQKYKVVVQRKDGKADITAVTDMPGDFLFTTPVVQIPVLNFFPRSTTSIKWIADANALFFNVKFAIRYREYDSNGNEINDGILNWDAMKSIKLSTINTSREVEIPGGAFENFLIKSLPPFPQGYRQFGRVDIFVEGGGKELEKFQNVAAASAGITGAEVVAAYSNVFEGTQPAYGLVMAKNSTSFLNARILQETIDSLKFNPAAKALNFR